MILTFLSEMATRYGFYVMVFLKKVNKLDPRGFIIVLEVIYITESGVHTEI